MNPVRIGFVMDPIISINPKKDTTLAIMLEAQSRGWSIVYMELKDLFLENGAAKAKMHSVHVKDDSKNWFEIKGSETGNLGDLDFLFMRKDPPFDIEYIMATYILEKAEAQGAMVINKPQGLRDANEKVFTSWFPQCCPESLLTRSGNLILDFLEKHQKIVIKPTCKMGGKSIFVLIKGDPNVNVIIEEVTKNGEEYVQVQKYISEISTTGDKRIILIDGEPVEYGLARFPSKGDHRGNLAAGGSGRGFKLSEKDRWICKEIGPGLVKKGLLFAGIDVIGDYLTEINVTSPTCIQEINKEFNINIAGRLLDCVVKKLNSSL